MPTNEQNIKSFFDAYAARFNDSLQGRGLDVEATAAAFANCFVEASPVGIICGENDDEFRAAIPKGHEFYKSIGTRSMSIVSSEITELDKFHTMTKIHWSAAYETKNKKKEIIDFDVIYFLQHKDDLLKIFAYITGDEKKVLKERGLV
jgi:hypothetical protein